MSETAISKALDLAIQRHAGQTDKAGRPYIEHVLRVALAQPDPMRTVVALLHDIVEDTDVSIDHIRCVFDNEVADAVYAITKMPGEDYKSYLERVRTNVVARDVKFADVLDNSNPERLSRLPDDEHRRLLRKYEDTFHALSADQPLPRRDGIGGHAGDSDRSTIPATIPSSTEKEG